MTDAASRASESRTPMSQPLPDPLFAETILHPTDFSEESGRAFAHALAVALCENAKLIVLHVGETDKERRWTDFPSVRGTLGRWGLLDDASDRRSVFRDLDVRVKKVNLRKRRPLPALLDYIEEHPTDLIVLATEGREGLPRWIRPSMAEAIARRSRTMTLFVPGQARGFVADDAGCIVLGSILVPVDHRPDPRAAVARAARAAAMSASAPVEIVVFHAGASDNAPKVTDPDYPFCTWSKVTKDGDIVEEILRSAEERAAGLIVMATEGHHGIFDALRGSVTEQVVRRAPCPVLAVPARTTLL
jgi:nucleotide-binding universal stress UspA family protein